MLTGSEWRLARAHPLPGHSHCASHRCQPAPCLPCHAGQDEVILEQRAQIYEQAKVRNPERWSQNTRNWKPVGDVWLTPKLVLEAA